MMIPTAKKLFLTLCLLLLPIMLSAQVDEFGTKDTMYLEIGQIDANNWTVTVSYFNDENIEAMSLPFKFNAGMTKVVADSAVYTGGRAETFTYKGFRPDSAIQCVTLGLIANLGPTQKMMVPGKGRVVTIFVSSLDDSKIENLKVDTTTTNPNNSMMVMASRFQGEGLTDTISIEDYKTREIVPVLIVNEFKK